MPVRTYSAGMMVRLSFSISTCVPPDILIMDEWLTAGDAQFLAKAQRRIEEFVQNSSILVLASHSMELVEQWCTSGILLHKGQVSTTGPIKEVIAAYRKLTDASMLQQDLTSVAPAVYTGLSQSCTRRPEAMPRGIITTEISATRRRPDRGKFHARLRFDAAAAPADAPGLGPDHQRHNQPPHDA